MPVEYWTLAPTDPLSAGCAAEILNSLDYPGDLPRLRNIVNEMIWLPSIFSQHPPDTNNPRVLQAWKTDVSLVALSGIQFHRQAGLLAASWLDTSHSPANRADVGFSDLAAGVVMGILENPVKDARRIVLVGHSWGGTVAYALATRLIRVNPTADITITTFGTPKSIGDMTAGHIRNTRIARYVTEQDPVPSIPPTLRQAPLLMALIDAAGRLEQVAGWDQPTLPLVIRANGTIARVTEDFFPQPIAQTTLTALVNSQDGFFGPNHRIEEYARRFRVLNSLPVAPVAPAPVLTIRPRPDPEILPADHAAGHAAILVFNEEIAVANAIPVSIPDPSKMTMFRLRNIWFIRWQGYIVATAPTKKKAAACCRHFNRFIRLFQGVGQSSSQEFVNALTDYLILAADPTSNFKPTLRDGGTTPVPFFWD